MSQQDTRPPERIKGGRSERPVLWGIVALVGVGLVIGLMATLGATVVVRVLGLDGGDSATAADSTAEASMYLPTPSPTKASASAGSSSNSPGTGQTSKENKPKAQTAISLSAGQSSVSSMQRIDLVGDYKGGEGAVLQVQRKENGSWSDFPVSVTVNDGDFSTYVQTGRTGKNVFRMADTDSKKVSNSVTVKVG